MFSKILHANDGSEHAFHALAFANALAKQNNSELHMIGVEEVDYMPEFIEEVREEVGTAARRYHRVIQRARAMADSQSARPYCGRPSRARYRGFCGQDQRQTPGDRGHGTLGIVRTFDWQSRRPHCATCGLPGARREVRAWPRRGKMY